LGQVSVQKSVQKWDRERVPVLVLTSVQAMGRGWVPALVLVLAPVLDLVLGR
jgi:hypothetical protein